MDSWHLLLEVVALLGACLVLGGICSRLRQSPLIGYLIAGMVLGGPGSVGVIKAETHIESIAELGVALLLFSLGLEFSWKTLLALGARALLSGALQVTATTAAGAGVALAAGAPARAALVIGGMISLSSTAAVLRVLTDRGEMDSQHGRRSLAILLVQDMAVVPLAILVELASSGGGASEVAWRIARILGISALLVVLLYVVLNYIAVRALSALSVVHNRELVVLLAVVVGLGATWAAHAAGLSPALGAFVAGLFLGGSPFASQIRADVSSLRIVLLTLFFGSVGMVADPLWIGGHLGLVLLVAAALIVGKGIMASLAVRCFERSLATSLATGLCLAQVGEFAFVLGSSATAAGVLGRDTYLLLVSSTIVTLFATPYLIRLAAGTGGWLGGLSGLQARPADPRIAGTRVLLIGFGPAGQAVGRMLATEGCGGRVVDVNPAAGHLARSFGLQGEVGDATQWDVLEHLAVRDAALVIVTIPDFGAALTILQHTRRLAPSAKIIVRSRYERNEAALEAAGADAVIGDERQTGVALAASALQMLEAIRESRTTCDEPEPSRGLND